MKYHDMVIEASGAERKLTRKKIWQLSFKVRVLSSPKGEMSQEQAVPVQCDEAPLQAILKKLESRNLDQAGLVDLGRMLAAMLLPPGPEGALVSVRELLKDNLKGLGAEEGVRLRLRLPPMLAPYPWEYVYVDRAGGGDGMDGFLSLDPRVAILRHEVLAAPGVLPPLIGDIKMVAALASPAGLPQLKLEKERADLEEAFKAQGGIKPRFLSDVTLDELQVAMPGAGIFHFAGHGAFDRKMSDFPGIYTGEGALALFDQNVPAEQLGINLRGNGVRLAVLGGCETGRRDEISVWSGIAPALVKAEIPAVVGNQYPISDKCAIAFSRQFYRALVGGLPVERAVSAGRIAAYNADKASRDWGVPVLYLRAGDGQLFAGAADAKVRAAAREAAEADVSLRIREVAAGGEVLGAQVREMLSGKLSVRVVIAGTVYGKAVGTKIDQLGGGKAEVDLDIDTVGPGGKVHGMKIDTLGNSPPKEGNKQALEKELKMAAPEEKPPQRYFTSSIEGGPEASGPNPQLVLGKKYNCVFGVKAEADRGGKGAVIPPEVLAEMCDREVQVLAGGEGLEIRNSCVSLKIHQDYTSAEAAVNFNAVKPGPCNLQLLLLLDRNVVRTLRYDFQAVERPGTILDAPPAEQQCIWLTPEEFQRLTKKELQINVSGGLEELKLQFLWSGECIELLPLRVAQRRELERKQQKFLSDFSNKMAYTSTVKLEENAAREFLEKLKELGEEIFRTLFILPGIRSLRDTGEQMRQLLRQEYPAQIQISPGDEHLPWMFLSDGESALGLRHSVEILLRGTLGLKQTVLDLTRKPLRLVCGLAPVFESQKVDGRTVLELQREALAKLRGDRFIVSFAEDETQWLEQLRLPADVIYAYCHGSSGNGNPCLWMTQQAKAISGSTIDSSPNIDWSRNPLVILAACTSGAIDPFRATGLANSFMARDARGYIAAEGQVPTTFASLFMRDFFEEFFEKGGKPVGEVLVDLRKRFLEEMNNPWGILFTQFCRNEIAVRND
jgi:CHAT domain-containing protein